MATGTVKRFFRERFFGFIQCAGRHEDLFFHGSQLMGNLIERIEDGMEVEFDIGKGRNGKDCATNVRPAAATVDFAAMPIPAQPAIAPAQNYRFLNPYNFARYYNQPRPEDVLGDAPPPPHDRYTGLSGVIECELKTLSPLFTADSHGVGHADNCPAHQVLQFQRVNGKAIIAGSSLRGMLRQVYEIVTHSCFAVFDHERVLSYRLPPGEALGLVPARVEVPPTGPSSLTLLPGKTPVHTGGFTGTQYAAWVRAYDPLRRSKTGASAPSHPYSTRSRLSLGGWKHGDSCWARMEKIQHPKRRGLEFWNVVELARTRAALAVPKSKEIVAQGYLCITHQNIDNKHDERFFFQDPAGGRTAPGPVPLPAAVTKAYNALLADYQDRHRDEVEKRGRSGQPPDLPVRIPGKNAEPAFSRFIIGREKLSDGDLVYAKLMPNGTGSYGVEFLVPVMIPRLAYKRRIADLFPAAIQSTLHKCDNNRATRMERLCPACRLFGWVFGRPGVEEGELPISAAGAYRGRLKVSHAECVEEHPWGETPIPLAILSTPKPTTSRFYLVDGNGKPIAGQEDSVSGYDGDVAGTPNRLRGRKIYRRHTEVTAQEYQRAGQRRDDQNRTIRGVVGPDSRFTFRIHFENLAKEELGGLLWSIELEKNWCHRLGMARPLGFGSVQVCVTELLHFDPNARYQANLEQTGVNSILGHKGDLVEAFKKRIVTLYAQQPAQQPSHRHGATLQDQLAHLYKPSFESLPPVQDLKALLGPEQPQLPVHYPRSEVAPTEDGKNFEWFMGNKRSGKDSGPRLALPLAPDDTQGFPLLNKQGNTP